MEQTLSNRFSPRIVLGFTLIWLGAFWILDEIGLHDVHTIGELWPIGIVLLGLSILANNGGWISSLIVAGFGLFLLNESFEFLRLDLGDLWPLALVAIGARMVFKGFGVTREGNPTQDGRVRTMAILGTREQTVSEAFTRGDATAFMGTSNLDLTGASFPDGATIDLFCLWGGITIRVSPNTSIVSDVIPVMASYEDKRSNLQAPVQTLHIRGFVMWGGVEIMSSRAKEIES